MVKVIAFFYFSYLSKALLVQETGQYFLALSIITVISVLDDLGLTSLLVREIAKGKGDAINHIRRVFALKLITIPFTILLAFILPSILHYSATVAALVQLAAVVMIADTLSLTGYGVLRGLQQIRYESIGMLVGQSLTGITGVICLQFTHDPRWLIAALMIGSVWNMFASLYLVGKKTSFKALVPLFDAESWPTLRLASAFFLAAIFTKIYSYVDSLLIARVMGESAVGIYAIAYKLTYAFQFIPLAYVAALYPSMSALHDNSIGLRDLLAKSLRYLSLLVFPIAFGIFVTAPKIILLYASHDYAAAAAPLRVLLFGLIFIFFDFPVGSLLNASGRQKTKTAIMGGTMVINVVANLILIPTIGLMGAAYAALLGYAFMFLSGFFLVQKQFDFTWTQLIKSIAPAAAVALFMAVVAQLSLNSGLGLLPTVAISGLVYGGGLLLTGIVKPAEILSSWKI